MSAGAVGGGNYISDEQIMAWLASQQDEIYGDLKASMASAERRSQMADDLGQIKADLVAANESNDFSKVDLELQAFMEKYGSDPEFAEVCKDLEPMATQIHTDYTNHVNYTAAMQKYNDDLFAYTTAVANGPVGNHVLPDAPALPDLPPAGATSYSDKMLSSWTQLVDGKLDVSGKNDQLTMIHIQQLKSTLDQGTQFGSTWIAGGDKAIDLILNNFG